MLFRSGLDWGFLGDIAGNILKPATSLLSGATQGLQYGVSQIGKGRGSRKGGKQLLQPAVLLPSQQYSAYM